MLLGYLNALSTCSFVISLLTQDASWILPDEDLPRASRLLTHLGLPSTPHSDILSAVDGEYHTKALYHAMHPPRRPGLPPAQHIVLFPASLITFPLPPTETTCEWAHAPPHASLGKLVRTKGYWTPRAQTVYVCLVRMMARYPRGSAERVVLASELQELVDYHLLKLDMGYVDEEELGMEEVEALDMSGRTRDAIDEMRSWRWEVEDEWILDALEAILLGEGGYDELPCGPRRPTEDDACRIL